MPAILNDINWLDIVFIILLIGMVYKGLRTGVGGQLISLIGLFILLFTSLYYYTFFAEGIFGFMLQKWAKPLTFFCISALIFTVTKVLERLFHVAVSEDMATLERVGGAIIAAIRTAILFGIIGIQLLLVPVDYVRDAVTDKSKTGMFFVNADAEIYCQMVGYLGLGKDKKREEVVKSLFLDLSEKEK